MFCFLPIGSDPALVRWFIQVGENDCSLKLECDCVVSFVFQVVVEGVTTRGKNKVGQNINHQDLVVYLAYKIRRKIGKRWIE